MRWTILVVIAACSYKAPQDATDGALGDAVTVDTPEVDAPPLDGPRMRTIDVVDAKVSGGPHVEFPLLIAMVDNDLRGVAQGGRVTNAQGFDIQFFADAGRTMQLSHELEAYDAATGQLFAWVKIPSLDAATTFFLYYGDPTITTEQQDRPAVWTADFAAVYHLGDTSDAVGQNDGTNAGSTGSQGRVGAGGRAFDGTDDRIDISPGASIDNVFAGGGTVEAWAFADTGGGGGLGRIFEKGDVVRMGRCDGAVPNTVFFSHAFQNTNGTWCSNVAVPLNTWFHLAVVYNRNATGNLPTMYVDGVATAVTAIESPAGASRNDAGGILAIGDKFSGTRAFDGQIDELRFTRTTRDAGWIATSYENQRDPGAFVVVQ